MNAGDWAGSAFLQYVDVGVNIADIRELDIVVASPTVLFWQRVIRAARAAYVPIQLCVKGSCTATHSLRTLQPTTPSA